MKRFYMVYSPTGKNPPTVRHPNYLMASHAAKRMANLHPGQEFFIMQAQAVLTTKTITTTITTRLDP